ncbi:hypothetical protein G7Y89_g9055 [Cudoniella acicularis]|uniref:Uncharacterized protein n=1 Tax=Cudoniella acicularis TaxID=354080 RepID=A0A8H4RGB9_9HELO|nr:hypothetical protein G7Y89_g9055 [Cudoniella acicularis]
MELLNVSHHGLLCGPENYMLPDWPNKNADLFRSFMKSGNMVSDMIFTILERQLYLAPGSLTSLHQIKDASGAFMRMLHHPAPKNGKPLSKSPTPAHTDATSITILFNWQGGLQITKVLTPDGKVGVEDADEEPEANWYYVKPEPGHVVVDLGDVMAVLTNGVLKSGKHRVVTPPGPQGKFDSKDIEQYNTEGILPQTPEDIAKIRKWLQPTDYLADSSEYKKHLNSYLRGTDSWIQQTEIYQKWRDSREHGALWTKAIAGAGKSVFAAMITDKLATEEKVPVLFFFFRQIVATNHHPKSLAVDFIAQLVDHSPVLQATMKKHMDNRRTMDGLSLSELWADLTEALLSVPKVFCVVDALDEMDIDQEPFFLDFLRLGKLKPSSIKLLMTSRPLPRIEQVLKDPSVLQIRLGQQLVDRDIAVYVNHRLNQRSDFNDDLKQAVKDEIRKRSQGSFLYARLIMDELTSHFDQMIPDIKFIQRSLDWLPVTLEDMYNGMLLDHSLRSRVSQELQVTILRWVTHSSRPLRLLELATMLDSLKNEKNGKDTKAVVRAACGPLLEILEDETVSVIHHSFTEFLTDSSREGRKAPRSVHPQFPVISSLATHRFLAVTCLQYLNSGCLVDWKVKPRKEDDDFYNHPVVTQTPIHLQHPFLGYAVGNWCSHVKKVGSVDEGLYSILDTFMQVDSHDFKAWLDLAWHGSNLNETSTLHAAAWAGLTDYATHLLELGHDGDPPDAQERTPLSWAAGNGHAELVALLIKHGSDPDSNDSVGLKPLHYSARANHHAVVKLLLDAGVSPLTKKTKEYPGRRCGNAPTTAGDTPLQYACRSGNLESVREMIPYLNAKELNSSLCIAAKQGKSQLVDLLLTSPDVSVDPADVGDTPLFLASAGLHLEIMRSLLRKGADPMRRSKNYGDGMRCFSASEFINKKDRGPTPFHAICGASKSPSRNPGSSDEDIARKCFKLLSEAGCDINALDDQGKTPLHYSVAADSHSRPNKVLSLLLLENGADPMVPDMRGDTPLHLMQLFERSTPTIEALIAHGADITARRLKDGRTPLHSMLGSIHGVDLKALLPYVTDWNVQDSEGNTPLHILLQNSYSPIMALSGLLKAGANLKVKNKKGEVPLHSVQDIRNRSKDVLPLLLDAGADLEAKDNEGRTLLMRVLTGIGSNHDPAAALEILLGYGSKIDTLDNRGNGVLHAVCQKSADVRLLRQLIDAGANPHCVNNAGSTLFHEVANDYKSHKEDLLEQTITLLLELGISLTSQNYLGQTLLHFIYSTPPPPVLGNKKSPIDIFTYPPFKNLIEIPDNNGVLPIHLAATISEELVSQLIGSGASSTALTHESRSILHIAARSRESNTVGLIIDHWAEIQRLDMIDHPDSQGRTALHDACRSGRPETVTLLLKFGANPNFNFLNSGSPLQACAEFEEENRLWGPPPESGTRPTTRASGVLRSDRSRPESRDSFNRVQRGRAGVWAKATIESDTARIRDTIRLLISYGADIGALSTGKSPAINLAMSNGCDEMVKELLPVVDKAYAQGAEEKRPWTLLGYQQHDSFHEAYVTLRSKHLLGILEEEMKGGGNKKIHRCHELLALREFDALEKLPEIGLDFTPQVKEWSGDFLSALAKWGYASLLETLGATVKNRSWVNGLASPENANEYHVQPYLLTAAHSRLPNLEVIRVLVEKFGANVNIQCPTRTYRSWQTEAVKYLLSKGANPELRNEKDQTALHVAVSNDHSFGTYRQRITTQILLEYGADPNSLDENGLSCLNKAIHSVELTRLLIKHGADITLGSKPVLFSAIAVQDLLIVKVLLETGADCNTRQKKSETKQPVVMNVHKMEEHEYYPVHYAASFNFDKTQNRDTAILIINALLGKGADPYLQFREDEYVLHHILGHGGILQPFLDIPGLKLECRDPKGRTLLLAACSSSRGTRSPTNFITITHDPTPFETRKRALTEGDPTAAQVLYEMGADLLAVDDDGNNALHLLILATPHNGEEYKKTFTMFIEKEPSLVLQKNKKGYIPYHYAVQKPRIWTVRELVKVGADPTEQDPEGNTALHHLASSLCGGGLGWAPTVKEFLDLGVSVNTKNNKGETPLFSYFNTSAQCTGNNQARNNFPPFKAAGADVFVVNNKGEGLLHVVAKRVYGNLIERRRNAKDVVDAFKFLIEMGLDPQMEDLGQRTALDVAAACGNTGILDLFKRDSGSSLSKVSPAVADEFDEDDEDL